MHVRQSLNVILICISLTINDVKHLFILTGHLCILFAEMSIQVFCPFFSQIVIFVDVTEFLRILDTNHKRI